MSKDESFVLWLDQLTDDDVARVGGKNASLGEVIGTLGHEGIRVPDGFATTAAAYRAFLSYDGLEEPIHEALEAVHDDGSVEEAGGTIRDLFGDREFPDHVAEAIRRAYAELGEKYDDDRVDVAVRSSATAEDLPEASFAGQQGGYLAPGSVGAITRLVGDLVMAIQDWREQQGVERFVLFYKRSFSRRPETDDTREERG